MNGDALTIRAGAKALKIIRDRGLRPADIRVVAGAAGGPKWIVLAGLDRVVFGAFLKDATGPVHLIGASSGAWRLAAVSRKDPLAGIERLANAYIHQRYDDHPTPLEISAECARIQSHVLDDGGPAEILDSPVLRLNVLADRCRGPVASERKGVQTVGLGAAFIANFFSRRLLRHFFQRTLFYHPAEKPPFFSRHDGIGVRNVPLSLENIAPALLASGSIPLLSAGIRDIHGAPSGIYRDGGVLDYQMDIPFLPANDPGIVLFPHYQSRIVPGWFDKRHPRRKPLPVHTENVVLLSPSNSFVESLPGKKIPDRNDFYTYRHRDEERFSAWKKVARMSDRLGEAFVDFVENGPTTVEPL